MKGALSMVAATLLSLSSAICSRAPEGQRDVIDVVEGTLTDVDGVDIGLKPAGREELELAFGDDVEVYGREAGTRLGRNVLREGMLVHAHLAHVGDSRKLVVVHIQDTQP